jgi:DNA-binding transcriptional regulator YdaS (Cro superfamily)
MKTDERFRARAMRAEGCSVKEIAATLGVARSSVSVWVRDVPLGPEQRAVLIYRTRLGPIVAAERKAERARDVRRTYQDEGRQLARERDEGYAAGCMLYWAEGAKARNSLQIVNADPEVLVFFARFLREHFDVPDDRMVVTCNLFADHLEQQRRIEDHWLHRLELPRACLRKSAVNKYSKYSKKKRTNKLPYGTCSLRVHSTRIVQTIYGSIQEYGGFERPEWLD